MSKPSREPVRKHRFVTGHASTVGPFGTFSSAVVQLMVLRKKLQTVPRRAMQGRWQPAPAAANY